MADEKKSKGKSKRKKLFIFIGALVILAAFICVLIVVIPQGKNSQENLNEVSSISIADNEDTKADFQTLADKIELTAGVQYYSEEVSSVRTLFYAVDDVMDFYSEYYSLVTDSNKHSGAINNTLNNIKNRQKTLNGISLKAQQETTNGFTHLQNVWIDYRAEFAQQLKDYVKLFELLNETYHDCLGNSFVVNEASKLVLNGVDDYMNVISQMLDALVIKDVKGNKVANYDLGSLNAKIDAFSLFVNAYLNGNRNFIANYYFADNSNIKVLNKFFEKFGVQNLFEIINSIQYSSNALKVSYENKTITDADAEALESLNLIKAFVKGGV